MSTEDPRWHHPDGMKLPFHDMPRSLIAAATLTVLIVVWTIAIFWFESVPFAILSPVAHGGIEVSRSLALIFGAVALFLFPPTGTGDRMRWVAFALVVLAVGGIIFNSVFARFPDNYTVDDRLYASIAVRTVASVLMAIGLVPSKCPKLTPTRFALGMVGFLGLIATFLLTPEFQPQLADASLIELLNSPDQTHLRGLTLWHWAFSSIPLLVIVVIMFRLLSQADGSHVRPWLIISLVLFGGSHLHNVLWPSIYSPVATTADVLRIGLAIAVLFGAFLELRKVAAERAVRLAEEREYAHRLEELQSLRADFTRMIAHELSNPLTIIRRHADALSFDQLNSDLRAQLVSGIQRETDILQNLLEDVHTAAVVEQDDFLATPRAVPLRTIISDAVGFAETIHLNALAPDVEPVLVLADSDRVAQVMRNLLTNAAKFSPPEAPVEILTKITGNRVLISVRDHGPGIQPSDQERIFEKFGRGRRLGQGSPPGLGLGLYISRRILRMHGSDLKVFSEEGHGAEFSFELQLHD